MPPFIMDQGGMGHSPPLPSRLAGLRLLANGSRFSTSQTFEYLKVSLKPARDGAEVCPCLTV